MFHAYVAARNDYSKYIFVKLKRLQRQS